MTSDAPCSADWVDCTKEQPPEFEPVLMWYRGTDRIAGWSVVDKLNNRAFRRPDFWARINPPNDRPDNPLKPSASLLIKLGSVIIHQEEMMSKKGHQFDKAALDTVRNDPEVIEWLATMTQMAFLPVKR